ASCRWRPCATDIASWVLVIVLGKLRYGGREPCATRVANQQHGAWAGGRHGVEHVVDAEVPIRLERHSRGGGAVQGERRGRFADERSEHALVRILSDAVAAAEQQTTPSDVDVAVGVDVSL